MRQISPTRRSRAASTVMLLLLLGLGSTTAQSTTVTSLPTAVVSPPLGKCVPWGAAAVDGATGSVDLAAFDYVEEEFIVSGQATVYRYGPTGMVEVQTTGVPYATRILVRRTARPPAIQRTWRPLHSADEDQAAKARRSDAALRKVHEKRRDDGGPVHSFQTLLEGLAGVVRNVCRAPGADEIAPTFTLETQRTPEQQRAYELLETIAWRDLPPRQWPFTS